MMILGLDQSRSATGFCYGDSSVPDKAPVWGVHSFNDYGENDALLILEVRKWLSTLCEKIRPSVIYFEQIVMSTERFNTLTLYEQFALVAGIQTVAGDHAIDSYQVDIGTWRKRFLGTGNAPKWVGKKDRTNWLKDKARQCCADRGWLILDHNAAEAAGIWDYGCAHADPDYRRATKAAAIRREWARDDEEKAIA